MCVCDHSACMHMGFGHTDNVSAQHFFIWKNSQIFLVLLTGFEPSPFGSESDALPIESPQVSVFAFSLHFKLLVFCRTGKLVYPGRTGRTAGPSHHSAGQRGEVPMSSGKRPRGRLALAGRRCAL